MIDHITIRVSQLEKSKAFYEEILKPLGLKIVLGDLQSGFYGFGKGQEPYFEIAQAVEGFPAHRRVHIAFKVEQQHIVDEFYKIALKAGAKDNGAPGLRPAYSESYYAAFILDDEDNNIEVCTY